MTLFLKLVLKNETFHGSCVQSALVTEGAAHCPRLQLVTCRVAFYWVSFCLSALMIVLGLIRPIGT